jgi:hypothetical protein
MEHTRRRAGRNRLTGPECLTLQGWGLPRLRRKFFAAASVWTPPGGPSAQTHSLRVGTEPRSAIARCPRVERRQSRSSRGRHWSRA